jgi:hypothetical protein
MGGYIMIASDSISGTFATELSREEIEDVLKKNELLFQDTGKNGQYEGRRGTPIWGWVLKARAEEEGEDFMILDEDLWNEQIKEKDTFYAKWGDSKHGVILNSHYIRWDAANGRTRNLITAEITKLYMLAYLFGAKTLYRQASEQIQTIIRNFVAEAKAKAMEQE